MSVADAARHLSGGSGMDQGMGAADEGPDDAIAVGSLRELPGFRSFDPETRELDIEGWGVTRLPPGFLKADRLPAPDEKPAANERMTADLVPVVGPISDPAIREAFFQSVAGWISKDGRILSNTSRRRDRTLESIRMVPGVEELHRSYLARLARNRSRWMAERSAILDGHEPYVPSPRTAGSRPTVRQIHESFMRSLHDLGWAPVLFCRLGGIPSVIIDCSPAPQGFDGPLVALATAMNRQAALGRGDERVIIHRIEDPEPALPGLDHAVDQDVPFAAAP